MLFIAVETVIVGFQQTSYQASEDPTLSGEVCAMISNLMGALECDLTVTFGALSNTKSGKYNFMLPLVWYLVDSPR